MTQCNGKPAELCALAYVEGTLPEDEAARFEEHYFDCPPCLAQLQTIQSAGHGLAQHPIAIPAAEELHRWTFFSWPSQAWAGAAAAIVLLAGGVVAYRSVSTPTPPARQTAQTIPAPAPPAVPQAVAPAQPAQLADLLLPAFAAPTLRGVMDEAHFTAGMRHYRAGQCAAALPELAQVPAQDPSAPAANFYTGVCQMHMGNLAAAVATLKAVAGKGDSPEQESALYYLAQIDLARNQPAAAHRHLQQAIALRGDLEVRARAEDRKVTAMMDGKPASDAHEAESKESNSSR